jgi:hypothetical protein
LNDKTVQKHRENWKHWTSLSVLYHPAGQFFLIGIVGGGVQFGTLGTAATNGLLCQPRVILTMKKLVEWLVGETEVHHKSRMTRPGFEAGPPRWEASD